MKNSFQTKVITLSVLYVALMIVFSFFDLKIDQVLFNRGTTFGKIFEVIGPSPMLFLMMFSGVSLLFYNSSENKTKRVFIYIGLGFALLYSFFIGIMSFKHSYAPWMFIPSIVLSLGMVGFTIWFNLKIKKKDETYQRKHKYITLAIFAVAFISLIGSDIIKSIFGRVRYINLANPDDFKPWFYINKFDFNSSFPSGHASRSLSLIGASFLLLYKDHRKYMPIIEIGAIVFGLVVSFSRIIEGMHYPTDVVTGLYIVLLAYIVSKEKLFQSLSK